MLSMLKRIFDLMGLCRSVKASYVIASHMALAQERSVETVSVYVCQGRGLLLIRLDEKIMLFLSKQSSDYLRIINKKMMHKRFSSRTQFSTRKVPFVIDGTNEKDEFDAFFVPME